RRTAPWSPAPRQQRSRPVRSTTAAQAQPGSGKNPSLRSSRPDPATAATTARPPNPPRPRSRFASARAIDQRGGAKARQDVDQHYFTSKRFDDLVADHLLAPIVATLHQHARPDRGDQPDRRVFREDHDEIDRFECGEHFARARSFWTGRPSPFSRMTEASLLRPTIRRSQAARAAVRSLTWPGCRISKQPLVKPILSHSLRKSERRSSSSPSETIFSSAARNACGRIFRRNSAEVTLAVPFLPTATAAAAFAIRRAVSQPAPAASTAASTAATVSPAPETSRTFTGCAGT